MGGFYYKLWDNYRGTYRISPEEAIQIALEYIPYELVEVGLGTENDILIYKVSIRTPIGMYEVKVDTRTGKVLGISEKSE
ncbi:MULTISPECIES: PepSY domain-containing protein [unclassified Clostridium]|uniref:PepSY domain-containing protein n=1 Tax=unclassified Clostridium TaxID=2614128 RepID=UPI000ED93775|nr:MULTISPECIES: PepSY domain-containing protein [unclassified Clostridium]HCQ90981.1 peptidase [Clostridium sp.]